MEISDIIRERRKSMGFSAQRMANLLGVNRATYYRYESSEIKKMPYTVLGELAKVLQLEPAQLLGVEPIHENVVVENPPYTNPVLELFNQLEPADQAEIMDIMRLKLKRKKDAGMKATASA